MRALVAWADDTSKNLGVRVLARGSGALAARVWPDVEVEHQNFGRGAGPMPLGRFRSMARERVTGRRGLLDWLSTYDVVLDTRSGDSLTDIYGLKRLVRMTTFAELAAEAGVPVVLTPQTIGPFTTARGRALGRWSLRRAAMTMVRDGESEACARSLGREPDARATDVVFALPVPEVPRTRDVLLNVSGLLWNPGPHVDSAAYRAMIHELIGKVRAEGRRVSLLAHVLDSPLSDNDVPAVHAVAKEHPDVEVVVPTDLDDVRRVVASAEVVVAGRMHACLNALSVGTPAIPTAYSRKFAPLLTDLGWDLTVDLRTEADPVGAVLRNLSRSGLRERAAEAQQHAQVLLRPAEDALRALL
ncbi:MAG TPA: polysaccharide pyruvyl transferase family protein [Actinotalea sp.]